MAADSSCGSEAHVYLVNTIQILCRSGAVGGGLPMGRIRSRQGGGEVIIVKTER